MSWVSLGVLLAVSGGDIEGTDVTCHIFWEFEEGDSRNY